MGIMEAVKEKAFQLALYWKSRPAIARQLVSDLGAQRSDNLRVIRFDSVRVAAVQVKVRPVDGLEQFVRHLYPLAEQAVSEGAQLLVFPEEVSYGLFGMLPGFDEIQAASFDEGLETVGEGVTLEDVLRFVGPPIIRSYRAAFAALSRAFGVYIVAGSTLVPSRHGIFNVAHFFGPDGRLLGSDPKTHLLPMERTLGVTAGSSQTVYNTRIGRIGTPVCMDASFFEPIRMLVLGGAEIIALPVANPEPYHFWRALRGLWPRVQESPVYGVKACLVGSFMGIEHTGKSAIYAPLALTPDDDGVVAEANSATESGVVAASIDLAALQKYREESGFYQNLNSDLYKRYLPWLYSREEPPPEAWIHDAVAEARENELTIHNL